MQRRTMGWCLLCAIVLGTPSLFLITHPRCEICGRRYGPLIAHVHRHPTTRQVWQQAARETAPVFNSLPPITAANRNLRLSPDTLVGRWVSQDGEQMPLRFHADGTAEVGTRDSANAWAFSTGKYQIKGDRVYTTTRYKAARFQQFFTFTRGVLHAPQGPSPQVVWKWIGDLSHEPSDGSPATGDLKEKRARH